MISLILFKMGKHRDFYLSFFQIVGELAVSKTHFSILSFHFDHSLPPPLTFFFVERGGHLSTSFIINENQKLSIKFDPKMVINPFRYKQLR